MIGYILFLIILIYSIFNYKQSLTLFVTLLTLMVNLINNAVKILNKIASDSHSE
jgi:hypothetical protein